MIEEILKSNIQTQEEMDSILNKYMKKLGTNVCLPFSLAFARVMAQNQGIKLTKYIANLAGLKIERKMPSPLVTIFSGGVHETHGKGSIQNIMIAVNKESFEKARDIILEVYNTIEKKVRAIGEYRELAASSGMLTNSMTTEEKFEMVSQTIKELNYENEVSIAIDVAAEHFYENGNYTFNGKQMNAEELYKILGQYILKYGITYVEDPFAPEDEEYWRRMKKEYGKIDIVGDDLFATQSQYINKELANGLIVKMNQVGTLTGTINASLKAQKEQMSTCVSHRSKETEDTFMCDLAVAMGSTYIKIGGPRRGDRIAKYNRLIRIEEEIK